MVRRQSIVAYSFLLPTLLFFAVFFILPVTLSLIISFKQWDMLIPLGQAPWVGLKNYVWLLRDHLFLASLKNTLLYSLGVTVVGAALSLFFAVLLLEVKFAAIWRFIFFAPVLTPAVAVGTIWGYLYRPTQGLINTILSWFGLPTPNWLTDPSTALFAIMITAIWAGLGYNIVIFTAALKGIPEMFYDAARMDGANAWQQFIHVTLPLLKPSILFVLVTGMIRAWSAFDLIFMMGANAPADSVMVVSLYVYHTAFRALRMGRASAGALLLFLVMFVITLFTLRLFKRGGIEQY